MISHRNILHSLFFLHIIMKVSNILQRMQEQLQSFSSSVSFSTVDYNTPLRVLHKQIEFEKSVHLSVTWFSVNELFNFVTTTIKGKQGTFIVQQEPISGANLSSAYFCTPRYKKFLVITLTLRDFNLRKYSAADYGNLKTQYIFHLQNSI